MPRLTLSMIVKNEEKYLRDCLESVKDIADDIVIVDTGSTDNTKEIAKEFNAKVFHFDWINDFSAARNYALKKSEGDWILYLDADERLDKDSLEELKNIIKTNLKIGYYCTVKSFDDNNGRDNSIRYVRLFKNSSNLSFTGKVHEQIVPSLQNNNYELLQSSIQINHIGYNISDEEKKNKAQRNLDLLLDDYKHKKSPYTEFQLGQTYSILNNTSEAERYFKLVINSRNISNDLKAESYAYLSHICHNNYNNLASEKYLLTAIDLNPKQAYYYLLLSKIALRKQDYAKAKLYCKKAFEINKDIIANIKVNAQTILLNPEEVLYFGLYLSYLTNDDNYIDYFFAEFYKIIKSKNQFEKMAVIKTMESILKGKELSEFIAHDMIKFIDRNNLDLFIEMIMKQKNPAVMCSILEGLHKVFPQNTSVIKNYSIALEQANNLIQAVELLDKNRELIQKDAGALFYLASFFLRLGNIEKSLEIFTYIENNFKHLSEMLPKIKLIKDKLLALNHQYN